MPSVSLSFRPDKTWFGTADHFHAVFDGVAVISMETSRLDSEMSRSERHSILMCYVNGSLGGAPAHVVPHVIPDAPRWVPVPSIYYILYILLVYIILAYACLCYDRIWKGGEKNGWHFHAQQKINEEMKDIECIEGR